MRIVLDTNILISGLFWGGPPRRVLDAARAGQIELFTSPILLAELRDVLERPKFAERFQRLGLSLDAFIRDYQELAQTIPDIELDIELDRDPDDRVVLACAVTANATAIVSGDLDLLDLQPFEGIPVLTATGLLEQLTL